MILRVLPLVMFIQYLILCEGRALNSQRFIRQKFWHSARSLSELHYSAEGNLQNFIVEGCPDDFRVVLEPGETEISVQWDENGREQEVRIYTGSEEFSNHISTNIDTIYGDFGDGDAPQCSFLVTLEGQPRTYGSTFDGDYGESWESWRSWESSYSSSDWYDGAIEFDDWSSVSPTNWQATTLESEVITSKAQEFSTTGDTPQGTLQVTPDYDEIVSLWPVRTTQSLYETGTEVDSTGEDEDAEGKMLVSTLPSPDKRTEETRTSSSYEEYTESPLTEIFQDLESDDETVMPMTSSTPLPAVETSQSSFDIVYEFTTERPAAGSHSSATVGPPDSTSPAQIQTTQDDLRTSRSYGNFDSYSTFGTATDTILEKSTTENLKYSYLQEETTIDSFNETEQTSYNIEEVGTTPSYISDAARNTQGTVWGNDVMQPLSSTSVYESQTLTCTLPDGSFIQVGESAVSVDCRFVCSCDETRILVCARKGCGKFEKCEQRDTRIGCFCQEGFTYDGKECIKDCPSAFRPFEDSCYYYPNKKMRFVEAEEFCQKMDANLTSILNERENQFISALVGVKKEVWIGAFRRRNQDPLEIITNGSLHNPQFLSHEIPSGIYRTEFSPEPVLNAHIFLGPEPEVVMGMYEIVLGSTGDFNVAIRRCPNCTNRIARFRSEIIQDNSIQGQRFYITFKNNMIEIGKVGRYVPLVSYVDMTGDPRKVRFIGFASKGVTVTWKLFFDFTWVDGSPWIYENWYLTEPDLFPFDDVKSCVFLNYKFNPSWNDDNCDHKRRFVCKQ